MINPVVYNEEVAREQRNNRVATGILGYWRTTQRTFARMNTRTFLYIICIYIMYLMTITYIGLRITRPTPVIIPRSESACQVEFAQMVFDRYCSGFINDKGLAYDLPSNHYVVKFEQNMKGFPYGSIAIKKSFLLCCGTPDIKCREISCRNTKDEF